jgi:hypothetical protein
MSAGTVGFTDTREDTNHIGMVISRILEARKLAEDERKYAEAQAEKYQTSLEESGIQRGYFFKKALRWKFGGEYKQKKLSQLKTWKNRGGMLKSAITGKSGRNKLDKFERTQVLFDMFNTGDKAKTFRDKFKPLYEGFVDDPMLRPKSKWVDPTTAKKTQKAVNKKQRVSKEDILDSLGAITESIQKVAESIAEKNKVVADQMIHSSVLQGMMHQQLKANANSLDDKLQKIINALSNQTEFQKQAVDKAETKETETKLEKQKDAASIVNFDNLLTKEDESKIPATSAQDIEFQQMSAYDRDDIPKAETGAVFSGPDSGYMVELHGNEAVVPLDNNYTQGEPSAIDGKVRPKPTESIVNQKTINSTPKYEMGTTKTSNTFNNISPVSSNTFNNFPTYETGTNTTVNAAPITSKFGFNTTKNIIGTAGGGTTEASKLSQSMVDVMSLPMMAAGGSILAATTYYMQRLGGEGANINPEIERVARPIAGVFGLPPSIVSATKKSVSTKKEQGAEEETGESKKNLFAKLTDGFGKLLEKLGDSINKTPGPGPGPGSGDGSLLPGDAPAEIKALMQTISGGEGGPNSVQGIGEVQGLSDMTIDDAISKAKSYIGNGSSTGALGAFQFHSSYLRERAVNAGLDPTKDKFSMENQTKIMRTFMTSVWNAGGGEGGEAGLVNALKSGQLETQVFPKLSKDLGWPSLPGGSQPNVHTPEAAKRYTEHLKKYETVANTPPPSSPAAQLGQAITSNYGLKVGQERIFNHPEYGEIKAHKTTVGFDFYDGATKLDMSKPQGKSIVEYFTSTNGGDPDIIRQSNRNQFDQALDRATERANRISSITPSSSSNKSVGGGITVLNTGGGQQIASAGSAPPPSGEMGIESGRNPTQDFYNSPFSLGIG